MIIAMAVVRMMQVALHEIVNMITMRYSFVTTTRAMNMPCFVTITVVLWGANIRVGRTDGDTMFVHMAFVRVMQMAVMQVINVTIMFDGDMAAIRAVLVRVVGMMRQSAGIGHVMFLLFFDEKTA